jgi:peptidoglycan/LPS O-acetylase OafA/YrhL
MRAVKSMAMPKSYSQPEHDSTSYPFFDWLRFVLASGVALAHFDIIRWEYAGNIAVQVFFALSGWLIGGILINDSAKSLPRFYFNRATRIWFPYFAAVAVLYIVSALHDPITPTWLKFLFYDVTFTKNWFARWPIAGMPVDQTPLWASGAPFWSIAVEEQFYLSAPLLIYATRAGRSPILWFAITCALLVGEQTDFASISAGVCAAASKRRYGDWFARSWSVAALSAAFVVTCGLIAFGVAYSRVAPIFALEVVLLLARQGHRTRLGKFLGGVSYPLYLNHWMGVYLAHALTRHVIVALAPVNNYVAYAFGLLVGTMAYLTIDRNVMASRGKWYSRERGMACAIVGYVLIIIGFAFAFVTTPLGVAP